MSRKRMLGMTLPVLIVGTMWGGYRAMHQTALNHDLILASLKGDSALARRLLDQGADANASDDSASGPGWQQVLNLLLRRKRDEELVYPLTEALSLPGPTDAKHLEIVRLLLEHHANPNINLLGGVPVGLHACLNERDDRLMTLLLEHGANPNIVDQTGSSLLMYAVESNKPFCVRTLLDHGAKPDLANADGDVPLMWAAYVDDQSAVALLLAHGADIKHKNAQGQTALTYAVQSLSVKTIERLLDAGADVNAVDSQGCSPFLYMLLRNDGISALMLAKGGDVRKAIPLSPAVQGFTIHTRTQYSNRSMGWGMPFPPGATPLMLAVQSHDSGLIQAILRKGADVNARDAKGQTALDYVDSDSHTRAVLLHAGAHP